MLTALSELKADDADAMARGKVTVMALDLSDLASVAAFVEQYKATGLPLHYLINNAGILMPGLEKKYSVQKHELQFAVNHLAHFYLTRLLEDAARCSEATAAVV